MTSEYAVKPETRLPPAAVPRVLFLLKHRDHDDNGQYGYTQGSGLGNSTRFVVDMLRHIGIQAEAQQAVDANDIDRLVHAYKPTAVIIEALWVVPSKFAELVKLHPSVRWYIHLHSELPFLANEGVAIEWLDGYLNYPNVTIGANSESATFDLRAILHAQHGELTASQIRERVIYLPNYYPREPVRQQQRVLELGGAPIRVGCFSAVRPMKNQLLQAGAAILFGRKMHSRIEFHINGGRVEQGGANNLKNIRALFAGTPNRLVEHGWLEHVHFLDLLRSMDIGMQVSLSETFNIVAADMVSVGLPVVVSHQVRWASEFSKVPANDLAAVCEGMERVIAQPDASKIVRENQRALNRFCRDSRDVWQGLFEAETF